MHKTNRETLRKELHCLVEIGLLTPVQQSQYGMPIFIMPKKGVNVRFITDYQNINQKISIKPYTLPIIGETMQQL